MRPFFLRYNNTTYTRLGTVYISEMNRLPDPVKAEFENGNVVVKRSAQKFNQVDPDQSQERLNGMARKAMAPLASQTQHQP